MHTADPYKTSCIVYCNVTCCQKLAIDYKTLFDITGMAKFGF